MFPSRICPTLSIIAIAGIAQAGESKTFIGGSISLLQQSLHCIKPVRTTPFAGRSVLRSL
jgi:hypothetical protein